MSQEANKDEEATEKAAVLGEVSQQAKNAGKRARQFDLVSMVAQSIEEAKIRTADGRSHAAESEIVQETRKILIADTEGSTSGTSDADGNSVGYLRESRGKSQEYEDDDRCGPSLPPGFAPDLSVQQLGPGEDDDDGFDEKLTVSMLIPAACEANINHGSKPVTAISFDLQGSKFATGGYSYSVHLYEFLKMDSSMKSFRQVHPSECHVINDIAFNGNGETLLVATGNCQLKLLDRQGKQWCETIRGDQYLVDLANTKGHTAAVNACCWNPLNKSEFLTCSDDGTLRIWDTGDFKPVTKCINQQRKVIKTKNASGKRAIPTTCSYSPDGKLIAAGCDDGSIQIWKNGKLFVNTTFLNRSAHQGAVTCLQFSPDSKRVLSRSMDDTLKLFVLSNFKEPMKMVSNLENMFVHTDCGYSPHAEFVYTGTSLKSKSGESGSLLFFDSESLELLYKIYYPAQGCIRVFWHPKINQILVGLSDGNCRLYYEPGSSVRGALLCAERPVRRARQSEVVREELILSPLTLEMFQPRGEEGEEKEVTEWRIKKFLRMQNNTKRPQFRKPAEMPMSGPSAGGRLAQSGGTLHSYIAQQLGTVRNKDFLQDEDVRASILKHAEEAEKNPLYVAKAYAKTQPKPIFQEKDEEEAEDDDEPVFKVPKLG